MIRWTATTGVAPADALRIRREVFLEEQKFTRAADTFDKTAIHIVGYDGDAPVGTAPSGGRGAARGWARCCCRRPSDRRAPPAQSA